MWKWYQWRVGSISMLQASAFAVAGAVFIPYEKALLSKAQELIAKGDFSIAVVVAHMACEISAERAISRAFAAKGIGYLEESVLASFSGKIWGPIAFAISTMR